MLRIAIAPLLWAKGAVALVAFAATLPAVRILSGPLQKILLGEQQKIDTSLLVGKIAVTDVGQVTRDFGRALVVVGGNEHGVEIRCKEGVISPRHTKVKLLSFEEELGFFWVVKSEKDSETA